MMNPMSVSIRRAGLAALALACSLALLQGWGDAQGLDGGQWVALAPAPMGVQEMGVVELNGLVYVLGGILGTRTVGDLVQVYDPQADAWSRAASMPEALHHMGVATAGGKLYVVGGYRGNFIAVGTVYEYDPQTDVWERKAGLPVRRGGLAAVTIDGLIYAVGGANTQSVGDLAVYDPQANTWTALPAMPTPRDHLTAVAIDGVLYAAGGRNQGNFTLDTLEAYDPGARAWTARAPMPTGRSGVAGAALGGCFYVFGGEGNPLDPRGVFPQVERYDPTPDAWIAVVQMDLPRHGIGAGVVGNRIHVPAGGPVQGFGVTERHDAFEVSADAVCKTD